MRRCSKSLEGVNLPRKVSSNVTSQRGSQFAQKCFKFLFDLWHYLKLFGANWLPQVIWSISSLFSANLLPLWFGILLETILGKLTPSRDSEHLFIIQGKLTSLCDLEYYQTLPDIARTPPTLAGGLRIPKKARVGGDGKNCVVLGGSRRTGG